MKKTLLVICGIALMFLSAITKQIHLLPLGLSVLIFTGMLGRMERDKGAK